MSKKSDLQQLKIALVYDRVNTRFGGAEQVLLSLQKIFPQAVLYTSVYDPDKANWASAFVEIKTSFLQHLPFAKTHHRQFLPLMPYAFESFHLESFDLVISVTSAEAKGVITGPNTLHICYLLTPTRYLWSHHLEYETGIFKIIKKYMFSRVRIWDFMAAQRPDVIIPISEVVKKRCEKYYRKTCENVIYPAFRESFGPRPISLGLTKRKVPSSKRSRQKYVLMVSRLVGYKNVDLAIRTCAKAKIELKIVGDGPERERYQELIRELNADKYIQIESNVSAEKLAEYYQQAQCLLLLAEEDFGIVALEAQAAGTPVIVNARSGAAEIVKDKKTGIHLKELTEKEIVAAIQHIQKHTWSATILKQQVAMYNESSFQQHFLNAVQTAWTHYKARPQGGTNAES